MTIDELEKSGKWQQSPSSGTMLAYTPKEVIFEKYASLSDAESRLNRQQLLEVHLFDTKKEYRAILSESKRAEGGFFDCLISDETEADSRKYEEQMFLDKAGRDKLSAINYLSFDENNGMAYVSNYRFAETGEY